MKRNLRRTAIATTLGLGMAAGSTICAYKSVSQPVTFTTCKTILEEAIDTMSSADDADLHQDATYALDKIKQIDPKYAESALEHAKSNLIRIVYSEEKDVNSSNESLKTFTRGVIADTLRDARTEAYAVENLRSTRWAVPIAPLGLGMMVCLYVASKPLLNRLVRERNLRDAGP